MNGEKITAIRVAIDEDYYIDIIPSITDSKVKEFWLHRTNYAICEYMFGIGNLSDEENIELAIYNAAEYIPILTEKCID